MIELKDSNNYYLLININTATENSGSLKRYKSYSISNIDDGKIELGLGKNPRRLRSKQQYECKESIVNIYENLLKEDSYQLDDGQLSIQKIVDSLTIIDKVSNEIILYGELVGVFLKQVQIK